ncbi:MAG: hypothetical protein V4537_14330 [Pseudomonadota bacterium]
MCDYPVVRKGKPGTCDARMCGRCRTSKGDDLDACPPHAKVSWPAAPAPGDPAVGDKRVHIETGFELWVVGVGEHAGERFVTFVRQPPVRGRCKGPMQTVPLAKWFEKTRAP